MKKKVLLSSIATIALCLCLIAGSTFALFTSQSEVNIAVTAGKVDVEANIADLTLYSVKANPTSGTVIDEYGYKYDYEKQNSVFANGGTATLVGNELTLDKVTPGDKVTFTIEIENTSDVATKYRTLVYCTANNGLLKGLEIGLDGNTFNGFAYTEWTSLEAGADIADVAVTVELPVNAGNEYQATSASLGFIVEAVQGNGAIAYDYLPDLDADGAYEIATTADLFIFASMVNNGAKVNGELTADIDLAGKVWTPIDIANNQGIVFDGHGHTISNLYAFEKDAAGLFGSASCSTISKVVIDKATVISNHYAAGIAAYALCAHIDGCTVKNSTITTSAEWLGDKWDNGDKAGAIAGYLSAQSTASVTNCTVEKVTVKGYRDIGGVVGYADAKAVVTGNTISDSTVICDPTQNYKNYDDVDEFDIDAIIGEFNGGVLDASNTATNVEIKNPAVSNAAELAAALKSDEKDIYVVLIDDIDVPVSALSAYGQTPGSGEYKLGGDSTETIVIDLNGYKLNLTTGYMTAIGAKNADATITIKNGSMNGTGNSATTWNINDLIFANCNYVFENVTFDKEVALTNTGKSTTMQNVTIYGTGNYYALWISARGQNVEIDGLTVKTPGRGIKIDEQYVSAPAKVTLNVSNAEFTTAKKAAIMVKSAAGADITLNNVDIANVAEDAVNAVWNDADAASHFDKVTVVGGSLAQEQD